MSVYTAYMVALLAGSAGLHAWGRDWASAGFLALAAVPFLAVPGLSDVPYLPVEKNSPFLGGILALIAAVVVLRYATQPWHVLIACFLGLMMILGGLRVIGILAVGAHAIALELVFVAIMLLGISARFVDIDGALPPLDEVRKAITLWQRDT